MNHQFAVIIIAMLVAGPSWAQSGSRNPVNSGGSGRLSAPLQTLPPSIMPAATASVAPLSVAPVNAAPPATFSPDGIPLDTVVVELMPPMSVQPSINSPSFETLPTPITINPGGGQSLGIPGASLNDPVWAIHDPVSNFAIDHGLWDYFLSKYVRRDRVGLNRVAYGSVSRSDRNLLRQYVGTLTSSDPRILSRNEQLAYWLNLYNSQMVLLVLDHYPLRSVRQLKTKFTDFVGPFDDPIVCVLGKSLSLNDIESGIIRPIWQDPRIHYALNCASYGCPNLQGRAWSSLTLDQDLNSAACQFINSGRAFKTGPLGHVLIASKIFKWYQDDFGGTEAAVLNHMRLYANASTRRRLAGRSRISSYSYDWSLNDAKHNGPRLLEALRR